VSSKGAPEMFEPVDIILNLPGPNSPAGDLPAGKTYPYSYNMVVQFPQAITCPPQGCLIAVFNTKVVSCSYVNIQAGFVQVDPLTANFLKTVPTLFRALPSSSVPGKITIDLAGQPQPAQQGNGVMSQLDKLPAMGNSGSNAPLLSTGQLPQSLPMSVVNVPPSTDGQVSLTYTPPTTTVTDIQTTLRTRFEILFKLFKLLRLDIRIFFARTDTLKKVATLLLQL